MTQIVNLDINQYANFRAQVTICYANNTPVNLASTTFTGQLRRSYYSVNASANFVCTIVDSSNGIMQMALSRTVLTALTSGNYVHDIRWHHSNLTSRMFEGYARLKPGVTR